MQPQNQQEKKKSYTGVLRSDVQIFPGETDAHGIPTWLLFDPVSDKYFRVPDHTFKIISQMNRPYELEEFCERLSILGIHTTKEKVMQTINMLISSNLCTATYGVTEAMMKKQLSMKDKVKGQKMLSSYLFFRVPLLRPDRFLERTKEFVQAIFNPFTMWFLIIIAVIGYVALLMEWHTLADAFIKSLSFQGLARYSIAVVFIKAIHELAHAYSAKLSGVRVRRMGVAFIVFFPRLYTDLTDAWRITSRRRRFLIDGAGIISELIIGGWAALVWAQSAPGLTKAVAYYVFAVSIINTVLVNGNPFIRYDGYYMLMDAVGIDNLQQRGVEQFKHLYRKVCFGIDFPISETSRLRRFLLFVYGIACFIYRLFLYTSIILIVYYKFTKAVGIVLFLLEIYVLVVKPISTEVKFLLMKKKTIEKKHFIWSASGFTVLLLILLLPLPWNVDMPCEVKPVNSWMIYIQTRGFLEKLDVQNGMEVKKGQTLLVCGNPFLAWNAEQTSLDCQLKKLELDSMLSSPKTIAEAKVKQKELEADETRLTELNRKMELLKVTSPINGIFQLYKEHLCAGKWFQKGEIIGEVFTPGAIRIDAFMEEADFKEIKIGDKVSINLSGEVSSIDGKVIEASPIPARLPPSPLLNIFGGPILCIPGPGPLYQPMSSYYRIRILAETDRQLPVGRTGIVKIRKFSSVAGDFLRKLLYTMQRELTP